MITNVLFRGFIIVYILAEQVDEGEKLNKHAIGVNKMAYFSQKPL